MSIETTTNEQRSRQEVESFKVDEPGPYLAYWNTAGGDHVTTWMGDTLATITEAREPFRSNMGDLRQNFRALAINGVTYAGTAYLSAGDYVRMRPVKG